MRPSHLTTRKMMIPVFATAWNDKNQVRLNVHDFGTFWLDLLASNNVLFVSDLLLKTSFS